MRTPFDGGLLETVDATDRRVAYVNVVTEDGSLGLIAWPSPEKRMVCLCPEGRDVFNDRLDGSKRWEDEGCEHETIYRAVKRQRSKEAVGISGERTYGISSAMWD